MVTDTRVSQSMKLQCVVKLAVSLLTCQQKMHLATNATTAAHLLVLTAMKRKRADAVQLPHPTNKPCMYAVY